jgi:hypothetical protein
MAYYTFKTPTVSEGPIGKHRLFYFRKQNKGVTIVKSGSTYSQIRYPLDESLATYQKFIVVVITIQLMIRRKQH